MGRRPLPRREGPGCHVPAAGLPRPVYGTAARAVCLPRATFRESGGNPSARPAPRRVQGLTGGAVSPIFVRTAQLSRPMFNPSEGGDPLSHANSDRGLTRASDRRIGA